MPAIIPQKNSRLPALKKFGKMTAIAVALSSLLSGCQIDLSSDPIDRCKKEIETTVLHQGYLEENVVLFTLTRGLIVSKVCPQSIIGLEIGEENILIMKQSLDKYNLRFARHPKFHLKFTVSSIYRYENSLRITIRDLKNFRALPDRDGKKFIRQLGLNI